MSDSENQTVAHFALTPRQRRLRQITLITLLFIVAMIVIGFTHPFFNLHVAPTVRTAPLPVRRAVGVKAMLILGYWAFCFFLALLLPVYAWLYSRDIRLQEAIARRDIWREVAKPKISDGEPPTP